MDVLALTQSALYSGARCTLFPSPCCAPRGERAPFFGRYGGRGRRPRSRRGFECHVCAHRSTLPFDDKARDGLRSPTRESRNEVALAKEYLRGDPVPLPPAHCRHRSIRHYAKGSERELMLQAHNLHVVRTLYTAPKAQFASQGNLEFLRQAKLREGLRANGPAHISSLRTHTHRIRDEADHASSTAYHASFALLQTSSEYADAATAASVLVDDAVVLPPHTPSPPHSPTPPHKDGERKPAASQKTKQPWDVDVVLEGLLAPSYVVIDTPPPPSAASTA